MRAPDFIWTTSRADVTPTRLRQYFMKEHGRLRVRKELRERVLFAAHNVLRDPPFSNLDLICCRNLLIYLDREMQVQVLQMFHFALKPGGLLVPGHVGVGRRGRRAVHHGRQEAAHLPRRRGAARGAFPRACRP